MNLDIIFDLLHCDIDVIYGLQNCDNEMHVYEHHLLHFVENSGFRYLEDMINKRDTLQAKNVARLLCACARKLGATYCFDLLHDMLGCLQNEKWEQIDFLLVEVKEHLDAIRATLQIYNIQKAV